MTKKNEFLEEGAEIVDVKSTDVKEEKPEKPKEPYVPTEDLKVHYDFLKEQCELLIKRSKMLEGMYDDQIITTPLIFKMLDEIHMADFVRNVSGHYNLTPEILTKINEFTAIKKQQSMMEEASDEDEEEDASDKKFGYKGFEVN